MPDRRITMSVVEIREHLDVLARAAHDADTERDDIAGSVKRIRTVLTDPLLDDHQKVDQALRVVGDTLKAWEVRRG